jgi:hypothetical protein
MRLLSALLISFAIGNAQNPGTVSVSSSTRITAASGAISCIFQFSNPDPTFTVKVSCTAAGASWNSDNSLASGAAAVGSSNLNADAITWLIQHPAATPGVIKWQIAANGVMKEGTF